MMSHFYPLFLFGVLASIATIIQAQSWPGPQLTTTEGGIEVWKASHLPNLKKVTTYKVQSMSPLPTIVYNCFNVPALCAAAKSWLGTRTTAVFHIDRLSAPLKINHRKEARRKKACVDGWMQTPRPDGSNRCPEPNQPDYKYRFPGALNTNISPVIMWRKSDGTEISNNRMAEPQVKIEDDGTTSTIYKALGAIMSCDEFPAASWIEGGEGAATYCAPISVGCKKDPSNPIKPLPQTEQGWQSSAFGAILLHFDAVTPKRERNHKRNSADYTIWKINFRYETIDNGDGVYVESSPGVKKYCYGPLPSCKAK